MDSGIGKLIFSYNGILNGIPGTFSWNSLLSREKESEACPSVSWDRQAPPVPHHFLVPEKSAITSWANSGAAARMLSRIHSLPDKGDVPKA